MGLGPWAQGQLIRDVKRAERAKFRRLLTREEKYLQSLIRSKTAGGVMCGDLKARFIASALASHPPNA